jgi:hypothetical protein
MSEANNNNTDDSGFGSGYGSLARPFPEPAVNQLFADLDEQDPQPLVLRPPEDPRSYSPTRAPDWRWQAALDHLRPGKRRVRDWEDQRLWEAISYLRKRRRTMTPGRLTYQRRRWPELSAAHEVFEEDGVQRAELEARLLLSGQPLQTTAEQMGMRRDVVQVYARFFFDVASGMNDMRWLLVRVLQVPCSRVSEGLLWKYWALAGGRDILDLLVADYLGHPQPQIPDRHRLAEEARLMARGLATDFADLAAVAAIVKPTIRLFQDAARHHGIGQRLVQMHLRFVGLARAQLAAADGQVPGATDGVASTGY